MSYAEGLRQNIFIFLFALFHAQNHLEIYPHMDKHHQKGFCPFFEMHTVELGPAWNQ